MTERKWTLNRLANKAGLDRSTLAGMYERGTEPSIATLEAVCWAFDITLSQFFAEGDLVELSDEQKEMFDRWVLLTPKQKQILNDLIMNWK